MFAAHGPNVRRVGKELEKVSALVVDERGDRRVDVRRILVHRLGDLEGMVVEETDRTGGVGPDAIHPGDQVVVGVDVVADAERDPMPRPNGVGEVAGPVRRLGDVIAVPPAQPIEPGGGDVEDPQPLLPQVLELAGVRVEQLVPVSVLVDGQEDPAVPGEAGDHSSALGPPAPPRGAGFRIRRRGESAFV